MAARKDGMIITLPRLAHRLPRIAGRQLAL